MGRHKEWRKIAKKERRRRIRSQLAKERDGAIDCNSSEYQAWLQEQEALELFEIEQIETMNMEENDKWLRAEKIAIDRWQQLQEKKEQMRLQRHEEEMKRKLEWELEQTRRMEEKERLKELEKENEKKQEIFMKHLEEFLSGDSVQPPQELLVCRETKPNCDPCPFFAKTACCRFGDLCSRNHRYPGISTVLLATNFYAHFGLENANEHDADIMLEYEERDTYKEFKEFFYDILPEFEKFGRIVQFKVCNNYEKHLRGNTYVEFAELRCAVAAYRSLHTRWYGGKQLSLQFCLINSWKAATCGLQSRNRCPKGRSCNFLHVFRNPNNLYNSYFKEQSHREPIRDLIEETNRDLSERIQKTPRYWRWSESPEADIPTNRSNSRRRSKSPDRQSPNRRSRSPRRRSKSRQRQDKRRRKEIDKSSSNKQDKGIIRQQSRTRRKSSERKSNRRVSPDS